jgi:hypothetical protein
MKGPILIVLIAVIGILCLVVSGCSDKDEITAIGVAAHLDAPLDVECVLRAVRSTHGVDTVYKSASTVAPETFMVHFMSRTKVERLELTGTVIHGRAIPNRQEPFLLDAAYQGDKMSAKRTDATYALLVRVAKRVIEDCGAKFTDGKGLRCWPEASSCTQLLTQDAAKS